MECGDGTEISSRVYGGREEGVVGALAARGVFEGDRPSVWEAIIVYLFPGSTARGHPSFGKTSLEAGVDAFGAGGDFQRYYSASISPIDSQGAAPFAFDGEPGD